MPAFPAHLAETALAAGLRLSAFDWRAMPNHEPLTGTAVIGDPGDLEAFLRRFVNTQIGSDGGIRSLMAEPDEHSTETVLYLPGYHLDSETEQT